MTIVHFYSFITLFTHTVTLLLFYLYVILVFVNISFLFIIENKHKILDYQNIDLFYLLFITTFIYNKYIVIKDVSSNN